MTGDGGPQEAAKLRPTTGVDRGLWPPVSDNVTGEEANAAKIHAATCILISVSLAVGKLGRNL